MHDLLFDTSDALGLTTSSTTRASSGSTSTRFTKALDSRKYALRVARDVESADDSGVAGTPTFFVNGRRHHGAYDLESLRAVIEREAAAKRLSH